MRYDELKNMMNTIEQMNPEIFKQTIRERLTDLNDFVNNRPSYPV